MFMAFMRHHYDSYAVMDEDGNCREASRAECFAPTYDKGQRWYWDDDEHTIAIRLPLTHLGLKIGNAHLAALKKDERYHISRLQCVGLETGGCRVTCGSCDHGFNCTSIQRYNDGLRCRRKCIDCPCYISRTVELDRPDVTSEEDLHSSSNHNPQDELDSQVEIDALMDALGTLTEAQRKLTYDIYWRRMTERRIAGRLKLKSSRTVNYRKQIILKTLRTNRPLREICENY